MAQPRCRRCNSPNLGVELEQHPLSRVSTYGYIVCMMCGENTPIPAKLVKQKMIDPLQRGELLLSVIIPTIGRPELTRTLRSITLQPEFRTGLVEVIVVIDTSNNREVDAHGLHLCCSHVPTKGVKVVAHSGPAIPGNKSSWGHPQRTFGATLATARWLAWMADDDIYAEDAFKQIFSVALDPMNLQDPRPILFQVLMRQHMGMVVWDQDQVLEEGHIDAECFVVPNNNRMLGRWTNRYQGDFDFIDQTAKMYGGASRLVWKPEIVAVTRPRPEDDWTGDEICPWIWGPVQSLRNRH